MEAKALVEAIKQIGGAMIDSKGQVNSNALKIRITEDYLHALSKIYKEVKIVGLPSSVEKAAGGSGSGESLSPENIATAMVMFQHVSGGGKGFSGGPLSPGDISSVQGQISQLMSGMEDMRQTVKKQDSRNADFIEKVRYLDDKTLY